MLSIGLLVITLKFSIGFLLAIILGILFRPKEKKIKNSVMTGIKIAYIDLCQQWDVFGIPSFIAVDGGKEIGRFVSKDRKTKEEITEFLKTL